MEALASSNSPKWPTKATETTVMEYCSRFTSTMGPASQHWRPSSCHTVSFCGAGSASAPRSASFCCDHDACSRGSWTPGSCALRLEE
jgi:hypothetical protein